MHLSSSPSKIISAAEWARLMNHAHARAALESFLRDEFGVSRLEALPINSSQVQLVCHYREALHDGPGHLLRKAGTDGGIMGFLTALDGFLFEGDYPN